MKPLIVAVDQGTASTKAQVLDASGAVVGRASVQIGETHPRPGWVEQDADQLRAGVHQAVADALAGLDPSRVAGVGLSTQRESMLLWNRATGCPLGPMISWQDGRTAALARELNGSGVGDEVLQLSGLPLDPMFSALKARWLLDHHDPDRVASTTGELCLGTVDSWLLSTPGSHVIEIGNASRTQLLDLGPGTWSSRLLEIFGVPESALPHVLASVGPFPAIGGLGPIPSGVPIRAVLGDSHAALFGHGVRGPGPVKATYGTGSSIMTLTDTDAVSTGGLCRTIAWQLAGQPPGWALEGNIRSSGATLAWLAALLGSTPGALAELAEGVGAGGVHLVPAFNGLGAPWWDSAATGLLTGLSLATGPAQVARAALESVAFQVADVVTAAAAAGASTDLLLADGGASANDTLMQLQADLTGQPVERSRAEDVSGLGAAHLAGLAAGVWDETQLAADRERRQVFAPRLAAGPRQERMRAWHDAVDRARRPAAPSGLDARSETADN